MLNGTAVKPTMGFCLGYRKAPRGGAEDVLVERMMVAVQQVVQFRSVSVEIGLPFESPVPIDLFRWLGNGQLLRRCLW